MAGIKVIGIDSPGGHEIIGERLAIGGAPDNDLTLDGALVHSRHAEIVREKNGYFINDLGAPGGVLVNNLRVKSARLAHGDVIRLGEVSLLFEDPPITKPAVIGQTGESGRPLLLTVDELSADEIKKPLSELDAGLILEELFSLEPSTAHSPSFDPLDAEMARSPNRRLFLLYQTARSLNSTMPLADLLSGTLNLVLRAIHAERGAVFLLGEQGRLKPIAARGIRIGDGSEMAPILAVVERAIRDRSAIVCADACYDPRLEAGASVHREDLRSVLCLPLWEGDQVFGAVYLDVPLVANAFTEADMDLLLAIASQIVTRIRQEQAQELMREQAVFVSGLERFHSPDVAKLVLRRLQEGPSSNTFLQEREVTILFSDISSFTPLIEKLDTQRAADLLNSYFEAMTSIIFKYKGTVDKYIGDAIMAIFGAPISYGNDAELAVFAAIEMMRTMEKFKAGRREDEKFDIRIGINTGWVVTGYLGSKSRIEYTVLGDPVNVAARLQHEAPPRAIRAGEATYAKVGGTFTFKDHGVTQLRGKKKTTRVYEVVY